MRLMLLFSWLLLNVITHLILSTKYIVDNPVECMEKSFCDMGRQCNEFVYEKSCLQSSISWQYIGQHHKIACCFKCCTEYYLKLYKLKDTELSPMHTELTFAGINMSTMATSNEVIFGSQTPITISRHGISDTGTTGNVSVMQITTLKSVNHKVWTTLPGRRIVLITPTINCPKLASVMSALTAVAPFSNPRVSEWFTTQLPCSYSPSVEKKWTFNATALYKTSKYDISKKFSNELNMINYINSKTNMIPMGVHNQYAMREFLLQQNNNNTSSTTTNLITKRTLLVDCSCARRTTHGIQLADRLVSAGIITCSKRNDYFYKTNTTSLDPFDTSGYLYDINYKPSIDYYAHLSRYKYILSGSSIDKLTYCEWEGWNLGVIPIISSETISNHKIYDLYAHLPYISVSKKGIQKLNTKYLGEIYAAKFQLLFDSSFNNNNKDNTKDFPDYSAYETSLNANHGIIIHNTHINIAKLYSPYWLYYITKELISGKPPSRFFHDISLALSRNTPECKKDGGVKTTKEQYMNNMMMQDVADVNSLPEDLSIVLGVRNTEGNRQRKLNSVVDYSDSESNSSSDKRSNSRISHNDDRGERKLSLFADTMQSIKNKVLFNIELVIPRCCEEGKPLSVDNKCVCE